MNHLDKAKATLESCSGRPINGTTYMSLLAIANALVAIAERESKPEHIEDKLNSLADNGAERSNDGVTRWHKLFGTPERAARTLSTTAKCFEPATTCRTCLYESYCDTQCEFEATLEFLRGDA